MMFLNDKLSAQRYQFKVFKLCCHSVLELLHAKWKSTVRISNAISPNISSFSTAVLYKIIQTWNQ